MSPEEARAETEQPTTADDSPATAALPRNPTPDDAPVVVEIDVERDLFRGRALGWSGLWGYRHLLLALVLRDVKARYKQTWIGVAWAVLQPALMMVVFTIFLGPLAREAEPAVPYPVYVYSGFLPWTFFSTALVAAAQSVLVSEGIITKTYFPRLLLPWAAAGAILVDFAGASCGLAVLLACYRLPLTWQVVLAPLAVVFVAALAGGVGTLFAALNVRYRDFRYLIPFLVQLWMFSTPLLFIQGPSFAPAPVFGPGKPLPGVRALLAWLNPMNGLITFFRAAVLGQPLPWREAGVSALLAAALALLGCWYYRRVEHHFADII
jgi:lipopolysaccharide transport system permease protein